MRRTKRCKWGIDNYGYSTGEWGNHKKLKDGAFDQCRLFSSVPHELHILDCGNAWDEDGNMDGHGINWIELLNFYEENGFVHT